MTFNELLRIPEWYLRLTRAQHEYYQRKNAYQILMKLPSYAKIKYLKKRHFVRIIITGKNV